MACPLSYLTTLIRKSTINLRRNSFAYVDSSDDEDIDEM